MIKDIMIGNRAVGLQHPVFLSAEVGTTCNGDFETSKQLIDAAKAAGMDAVKFQILDPDDKYSDRTLTYTYTRHNGEVVTQNIYEMLKKYVQPKENWKRLKAYADAAGILMFATPDYIGGVELMEELGMPAYKIATWDVTYYPFVRAVARTKKPVVVDFGASDTEEIARVLKIFEREGNDQLILLHCYHTDKYEQMNIRSVAYLREAFGYLSGFSASDEDHDIDYLSLPYQPVYIEKRLTLDRTHPEHHHSRAVEPEDMKRYVARIRQLSLARGEFTVRPSDGDLKAKEGFFRRLVAKRPIRAGERFTEENLACRRPWTGGLDPKYYEVVLGRTAKKDMNENDPVTWEEIT